jgi:hypothetical protein
MTTTTSGSTDTSSYPHRVAVRGPRDHVAASALRVEVLGQPGRTDLGAAQLGQAAADAGGEDVQVGR